MASGVKSSVQSAASRLRALALGVESGVLLGSEDALIAEIGFSRPTVRQAARMLENEGLLKVRRGSGGGYLAARPDMSAIEQTVAVYMEMKSVATEEMTTVTSILWIEAVRRAAERDHPERAKIMAVLLKRVEDLTSEASLDDLLAIEDAARAAVFRLVDTHYIELIFQISETFAHRRMVKSDHRSGLDSGRLAEWQTAKTLELESIAKGDPVVAVIGAQRVRAVIRGYVLLGRPA